MTREEFERLRRSETDGRKTETAGLRMMAVVRDGSAEGAGKAEPEGFRMAGSMRVQDLVVASMGLATAEGIVECVLEQAEKALKTEDRPDEVKRDEIMEEQCRKALLGIRVIKDRVLLPVLQGVVLEQEAQRQRQARRQERSRRRAAEHERRKTDGGDAPEE